MPTRDDLILENMKLVNFVLHKYFPRLAFDEDMIQVGMVGLCRAAENYDESKGKFTTLAARSIRNTILNELRDNAKNPPALSLSTVIYEGDDGEVELEDSICGDADVDYYDFKGMMSTLTPRERKVAEMLADGCTQEDIAKHLGVARTTVQRDGAIIKRKLKGL